MELWPASLLTVVIGTPFLSSRVQKVWRNLRGYAVFPSSLPMRLTSRLTVSHASSVSAGAVGDTGYSQTYSPAAPW